MFAVKLCIFIHTAYYKYVYSQKEKKSFIIFFVKKNYKVISARENESIGE